MRILVAGLIGATVGPPYVAFGLNCPTGVVT